ncbi:6-bladed beta-propeller [Verrucomicrobiaceae bacterium N1E253]|uniref:6-bladed beta-propeller n=1 Tax=Oceaniferula marina TaxID=2748318 RepID=A0A851GGY8_9BACT|nr:6-bladed beta-propeller [Oceaniferula marina]NWK56793.1 6-bladed beta-propeller [Oceaniferula marina]
MKPLQPLAAFLLFVPSSLIAHEGKHDAPAKPALDTPVLTGNGEHRFMTAPRWAKMPDGRSIGPTHGGVAVGPQGNIYVSTDAKHALCVFRPDGSHLKNIAPDCVGLHSLVMHEQGGKHFLYGAHLKGKRVVKLDLDGKLIMSLPAPGSDDVPGGFKGVTAVAVAPDDSIYVAVGYGSNLIHKFSPEGKLIKSIGGKGGGEGKFKTCHGLAVDLRFGAPRLLVADRENRRLVHLDLEGNWLGVYASHLRRPCAIDFHGEYCAVAELEGRVTILSKQGAPLAFLGDNPNRKQWAKFPVPVANWQEGVFTAPHGLAYDAEGRLYVQDWNATGRVTKLVPVER